MRFVWKEPATWVPLMDRTFGHRQTANKMVQAICETYHDIEVFHGARAVDVDSYYSEGLRLADHDSLTAAARKIFLSGEFPELDEAKFQAAVQQLSGIDNRRVYTALDDRVFLNDCGHYLIYGSEHIGGIAAALSRNGVKNYQQVLKRFGRPTIFRLSLPVAVASKSDLLEFGQFLMYWVHRVRAGRRPLKVDFTFTLRSELPPSSVLGHEHPDTIKDPLLPMRPYYHYRRSS